MKDQEDVSRVVATGDSGDSPTASTVAPDSYTQPCACCNNPDAVNTTMCGACFEAWEGRCSEIAQLRADLWNIAGGVVAVCDSQNDHIAKLACMEGSPLVGSARAVLKAHKLGPQDSREWGAMPQSPLVRCLMDRGVACAYPECTQPHGACHAPELQSPVAREAQGADRSDTVNDGKDLKGLRR